jgi:cell division protein FtsQ
MTKALVTSGQSTEPDPDKVALPIGLSVFALVIVGLIFGVYKSYAWLQDEQRLPVQDIVISGDIEMLNTDYLTQLVRQRNTGSFFAIDINQVHSLVEQQPWVFSASIRKRWPSSLYIHIVEQQAVARWNEDLLLNKNGASFDGMSVGPSTNQAAVEALQTNLVNLFGPGGSESATLAGYSTMRKLLAGSGETISQLSLNERFAWTVQLESGINLNIGRQEYIKRLQRFIDVYPLLKKEKKAINYIDLRYDTGLAVGWADAFPIVQAETDNNTNN